MNNHYNDTGLTTGVTSKLGSTLASLRGDKVVEAKERLVFSNQAMTRTQVSDRVNEIRNVIVHEGKHHSDYKTIGSDKYHQVGKTPLSAAGRERRTVNA